jgi:hypothetical protein
LHHCLAHPRAGQPVRDITAPLSLHLAALVTDAPAKAVFLLDRRPEGQNPPVSAVSGSSSLRALGAELPMTCSNMPLQPLAHQARSLVLERFLAVPGAGFEPATSCL